MCGRFHNEGPAIGRSASLRRGRDFETETSRLGRGAGLPRRLCCPLSSSRGISCAITLSLQRAFRLKRKRSHGAAVETSIFGTMSSQAASPSESASQLMQVTLVPLMPSALTAPATPAGPASFELSTRIAVLETLMPADCESENAVIRSACSGSGRLAGFCERGLWEGLPRPAFE